jgi:hypothetical protein
MLRFAKPECPVQAGRAYDYLYLTFCETLVICITKYMFKHTFVAPLKCIDIWGTLLDLLEKCAKWHQ